MAVVGGIIGSGIFMNSAIVAQRVGTAALTLAVWILGGVIALIGAFCFGDWPSGTPGRGSYVYLRDAFGPRRRSSTPGVSCCHRDRCHGRGRRHFATYCSALLGLGNNTVMPIAAGAIALLSAVNYVGVEPGAIT
jgi:APA family basic amino acid/polyamine antiporter